MNHCLILGFQTPWVIWTPKFSTNKKRPNLSRYDWKTRVIQILLDAFHQIDNSQSSKMLVPKNLGSWNSIIIGQILIQYIFLFYHTPNNRHGLPENTPGWKRRNTSIQITNFWVPAVCGFESVVSSGKKGQNQTRIIHKAKLHSPKQPSLMEDKVLANLNKSSASHTCVRKNNGE